jgi:histone deacetylase HOS3
MAHPTPPPRRQSSQATHKRLSLNIKDAQNTPLPTSPAPAAHNHHHHTISSPSPRAAITSPAVHRPSPSPLRRSSSSLSIDFRASSPALGRRTSLISLRNGGDSPGASPKLSHRRSSANLLMQLAPALEEPPAMTANSIAHDYFARELGAHEAAAEEETQQQQPSTVVLLHDDCYGHRFARPKVKQADLNLIVERPERLRAGAMGVAAAYVLLGGRHAGGRHAPHPRADAAAAARGQPPFRIRRTQRKVSLVADEVTAVHGVSLMKELKVLCAVAGEKLAAGGGELEREKEKRPLHSGDLYLCQESINALEGALGGVCDAVDAVFEGTKAGTGPYQAFACIRPPGHHCSSDYPSGFCWLNNVHVGIQYAIKKYGLTHAAIIDFDLHHGDGSQEIAWGHNERMFYPDKQIPAAKKTYIGYFSLHDINSFPCEMGDREKVQNASLCVDNAHGQSVWNIHLQPWKTPEEFWELYERRYSVLLDKVRAFLKTQTEEKSKLKGNTKPKSAIFISAGFDASEHETDWMQRHNVFVPTDFYARFTRDIVNLAQEQGTSVDGRVVSVLEGGYSNKALVSGILSHISGLCDGDAMPSTDPATNGLGMTAKPAPVGLSGLGADADPAMHKMRYDARWWHRDNLDALDELLEPQPVASANPRRPRMATFNAPTHASAMKIVDPARVHRSASTSSRAPSASPSRAPSPPPPEVDWATACGELAKLLIPGARETRSLTAAQLGGETKAKRGTPAAAEASPPPQPAAAAPAVAAAPSGRTLRERKPKPAPVEEKPVPLAVRQRKESADRRRTIAVAPPAAEAKPAQAGPRRRLSIASSTLSSAASAGTSSTARPKLGGRTSSAGIDVKKTRVASSTSSGSSTASRRASVTVRQQQPALPRIPSEASVTQAPTAAARQRTAS